MHFAALTAHQEHARDSFENLLFSLCRFHEITGRYPARITAVSYTLKQKRFEQLHRAAVRFPTDAFSFIGTPVSDAGVFGGCAVVSGAQRGGACALQQLQACWAASDSTVYLWKGASDCPLSM
jgi:hypothetical protein